MSSPRPRPDSAIDGVFARRYRVLSTLGSGSVGTVYLAHDLEQDRRLALKVLHADRLRSLPAGTLEDEFRAIVPLRHPQIAAAWDFGYSELDRVPFYTREFVEGYPLPAGPPPLGVAARDWLRPIFDLLDALEYLHAHEILHLDLHAGNLIVQDDVDRGAVLIDFGLPPAARSLIGSTTRGETTLVVPAPELLAGEPPGPAADVYATGRLLLHRLTGRYGGDERLPREIPGWGARRTVDLERIVRKALQRDPAQRFSGAREFRDALSAALGAGERRERGEPGELTVGRDRIVRRVDEGLSVVERGGAFGLWLHGPSGLGKTRLLTDAKHRAQLRGLDVVEVRFLPSGGASGRLAESLERVLRPAGSGPEGGTTWRSALSSAHGGSTRERVARATEGLLDGLCAPLVVIVDDVDDADRESRLLVEELLSALGREHAAARPPHLGLLVASGQPPNAALPAAGEESVTEVEPLAFGPSRDLAATLLRPLVAHRETIDRLARAARGSPRRLRRLARALGREFEATGRVPREAELPSFVEESELDTDAWTRLGADDGTVLEALSCLGSPSSIGGRHGCV